MLHVTDKTATELPFAPGFLVRPGSPHLEITRVARARDTDLIVMATHGRGLVARTVLGSVAEQVVRHAVLPGVDRAPFGTPRRRAGDRDREDAPDDGAAGR